jgi:hypothetical protein
VNPVSVNPSLGDDFPNLSWGNVTERREFSFGVGGHGGQVRRTHYNYAHISGNTNYNVNYVPLNIANLVTEKQVFAGTSTTASADSINYYDGSSVTTTSGVPNHDYTIGTYRGNKTKSSVWRNSPAAWLDTTHIYNDLGHVTSTTDPAQKITSFDYTDIWSGATCGVGTNTQAFLTLTTAPATTTSHRSKNTYYPCTGQVQMTQDENDILANRSGTTYTYDSMLRLLRTKWMRS